MGDHYVPQYYLKGFSNEDGKEIWVYDKLDSRVFATQVKSIANENDFYGTTMERYLANTIEGPANTVLKRIRERGEITQSDKMVLSEYIVVMMKRVPEGRSRANELAPSVAEKLAREINDELSIAASEEPEKAQLIEERRAQINEILDRYSSEPPKDIWLGNIPPEKTPRVVEAIATMTWRFLTCDESPAFLASDNPVFYFTGIGVGKPESEVTLPISSHLALWATWRSDLPEGYFPTTRQAVKEVNRRTASSATRYVFHQREEEWILPFIQKGRWQLHRLQ
jgi:hypothetical protein